MHQWQGLANGLALDYLYFNSRPNQVTGFSPSTRAFLVNSGINLYWKSPGEPFRFAFQNTRAEVLSTNAWSASDPVYPPPNHSEINDGKGGGKSVQIEQWKLC